MGGNSALPPAPADDYQTGIYCVVVHPLCKSGQKDGNTRSAEGRLSEAVGLAEAIGLVIAHSEVIGVPSIRPSTFFGVGTIERLKDLIANSINGGEAGIIVAVVDTALTPIQQRNLERAWSCKVVDRTALILEIFGERARTAEGRLQVELAALVYQRSRLVRTWTHLERQRGGFGFMGGPGEAQIESDRRLIGDRIAKIRQDLEEVRRTRALQRKARKRVPYPVVALVGYTNAGKSTLFNRLTRADVTVKDQLFATLDPTMRRLELPSGRVVILSDTVGFISDLPHELVEAFRATLEEVIEADVIVHVRNAAHQDSEAQRKDVEGVLEELGLAEAVASGLIEAINKIDLLQPSERETLANRSMRRTIAAVPISAKTGEGCDELLRLLEAHLRIPLKTVDVRIEVSDGASLAWLYQHGEVVERHDDDEAIRMKVNLDTKDAARLAQRLEKHKS